MMVKMENAGELKDAEETMEAARGRKEVETKEILKDVLENVMLDVRKNEAALLEINSNLERENTKLRNWKRKMTGKASELERKRVELMGRESKAKELAEVLVAKERMLAAKEDKLLGLTQKRITNTNIEKRFASTMLEYMVKCEELIGNEERLAHVRSGLDEKSSFDQIKAIIPAHLDELEASFERMIVRMQTEIRALTEKVESKEESKVATATAASRIREKKLLREKGELIQTLVTVENLCNKFRASPTYQQSSELETMRQIIEVARARFQAE